MGDLGEGLRDNGPDARLDPWAARADEWPARLDGDPEATAVRIAGDDRVRHWLGSSSAWSTGAGCRRRDTASRFRRLGVFTDSGPASSVVTNRWRLPMPL
jgi:hypothetical protein